MLYLLNWLLKRKLFCIGFSTSVLFAGSLVNAAVGITEPMPHKQLSEATILHQQLEHERRLERERQRQNELRQQQQERFQELRQRQQDLWNRQQERWQQNQEQIQERMQQRQQEWRQRQDG
jgi:hypothetical protein